MELSELKVFLDEKANQFNHPDFIEQDPIQIPHGFCMKQDIEISGFLTSTIAWGNRKSIIKDAEKMMGWMEHSPFDFVVNFTENDLNFFEGKSVHRTFNGEDFSIFLKNLQKIYKNYASLEDLFLVKEDETNFYHSLQRFRDVFFEDNPTHRSTKHISSTYKNASAKRLMMFLRWMVRKDKRGVDFGLWENIKPALLSVPLDVHTGKISRKLNLVRRKQNDWKTVEEMDLVLRKFNPKDPAVYDFALFGLGVSKEI